VPERAGGPAGGRRRRVLLCVLWGAAWGVVGCMQRLTAPHAPLPCSFVHFLEKGPQGVLNEHQTRMINKDTAINSGICEWRLAGELARRRRRATAAGDGRLRPWQRGLRALLQ